MEPVPFEHLVTSEAELRLLYREPSSLVRNKKQPLLDAVSIRFVESTPLMMLGTAGADGAVEVSPRGGPPGWVKVIDPTRLAIPDFNGNNLIDSITNIVGNPSVGLLFVHPGKDETLRVNGRAWITTDPDLIIRCSETRSDGLAPAAPKAIIGVQITDVFIHCAKAFRRGSVWQPGAWASLDKVDAIDILRCQMSIDTPREQLLVSFADGYASDLASDLAQPQRDS